MVRAQPRKGLDLLALRLAQLRSRGLLVGTHSLAHPRGGCLLIQVGRHAKTPPNRPEPTERARK